MDQVQSFFPGCQVSTAIVQLIHSAREQNNQDRVNIAIIEKWWETWWLSG